MEIKTRRIARETKLNNNGIENQTPVNSERRKQMESQENVVEAKNDKITVLMTFYWS